MDVFKGLHRGTFTVTNDKLLIRGIIHGDLRIHGDQADVDLRGMVRGNVLLTAGKLTLPGMVSGNIDNQGGQLTVSGLVQGTITTAPGASTVVEKVTSKKDASKHLY